MKMFFTFVLHWQNTTTLSENKYYQSLSPRCFQFSFCEMNIKIISCWRMTVQMIWKKHKLNFTWQFCGNVREMWFNNVNCVTMSRCLCLCISCLYPQIYLCILLLYLPQYLRLYLQLWCLNLQINKVSMQIFVITKTSHTMREILSPFNIVTSNLIPVASTPAT